MSKSKNPYKKQIIYSFEDEVCFDDWNIISISEDTLEIEEGRKNGQEDTHRYIFLTKKRGKWKIDDAHNCMGEEEDVLKYINKYGPPKN